MTQPGLLSNDDLAGPRTVQLLSTVEQRGDDSRSAINTDRGRDGMNSANTRYGRLLIFCRTFTAPGFR